MSVLHFEHPVHSAIKGSCATPPTFAKESYQNRIYESPVDLEPEQLLRISKKNRAKGRGCGRLPNPKYRYQGQEVHNIWNSGELRPSFVRQLRPELRLVMGFWRQAEIPTLTKANLCGCSDSGEFLEINRKLLTQIEFTRIDAIRHCILHGLPLSAAVELQSQITCRSCGERTKILPCIFCWRGLDDDTTLDNDKVDTTNCHYSDDEIRKVCSPTDAMPGTKLKVEVLRLRAERGLPLWHPDDPAISLKYQSRWWIHD